MGPPDTNENGGPPVCESRDDKALTSGGGGGALHPPPLPPLQLTTGVHLKIRSMFARKGHSIPEGSEEVLYVFVDGRKGRRPIYG
jgi:hypothetical protein